MYQFISRRLTSVAIHSRACWVALYSTAGRLPSGWPRAPWVSLIAKISRPWIGRAELDQLGDLRVAARDFAHLILEAAWLVPGAPDLVAVTACSAANCLNVLPLTFFSCGLMPFLTRSSRCDGLSTRSTVVPLAPALCSATSWPSRASSPIWLRRDERRVCVETATRSAAGVRQGRRGHEYGGDHADEDRDRDDAPHECLLAGDVTGNETPTVLPGSARPSLRMFARSHRENPPGLGMVASGDDLATR